jgi:hypothetical protein
MSQALQKQRNVTVITRSLRDWWNEFWSHNGQMAIETHFWRRALRAWWISRWILLMSPVTTYYGESKNFATLSLVTGGGILNKILHYVQIRQPPQPRPSSSLNIFATSNHLQTNLVHQPEQWEEGRVKAGSRRCGGIIQVVANTPSRHLGTVYIFFHSFFPSLLTMKGGT